MVVTEVIIDTKNFLKHILAGSIILANKQSGGTRKLSSFGGIIGAVLAVFFKQFVMAVAAAYILLNLSHTKRWLAEEYGISSWQELAPNQYALIIGCYIVVALLIILQVLLLIYWL